MFKCGEPLFDCRWDRPQHKDKGHVHPPQQGSSQDTRLLVVAGDVAGDGVEALVGPGDGQELLPPPWGHVGDVEAQDKGQGNEVEERIKVFHNTLEQSERLFKGFWTQCQYHCTHWYINQCTALRWHCESCRISMSKDCMFLLTLSVWGSSLVCRWHRGWWRQW